MNVRTPPSPPAHVLPFVEILGTDEAARFLTEFGGGEMMLGRTPGSSSMVAQEFGQDVAQAIGHGQYEGTLPRRMPMPRRWLVQYYHHKGWSQLAIARKLKITSEAVRLNLKPAAKQTSQLDLFGG